MPTRQSLIDEVSLFSSLTSDWSGYGSPAPSKLSIELAIKLIQCVLCYDYESADHFEVGPSLDGGVNVSYDNGNHWCSVHVKNNGNYHLEDSKGMDVENAQLNDVILTFPFPVP